MLVAVRENAGHLLCVPRIRQRQQLDGGIGLHAVVAHVAGGVGGVRHEDHVGTDPLPQPRCHLIVHG